MLNRIRNKIIAFTSSENEVPILAAVISGLYPLLYFYSNSFVSKNSLEQITWFTLFFVGISLLIFLSIYYIFGKNKTLKKYKKHLLFVLIIFVTSAFLSKAIYFKLMKKALVLVLILSVFLSVKYHKYYKKMLVLLMLACAIPFFKVIVFFYDSIKPLKWQEQTDSIEHVEFKIKPNIYLIQPDGYVSESTLLNVPYNSKSNIYSWLKTKEFKVYPNFRSNYPATLASNASMFSMKQHYFGYDTFKSLEMINSRNIISGDNPVISVFNKNNYDTFLVVEKEYFQNNYSEQKYDYRNISFDEIPLFSWGTHVTKNVTQDLKSFMAMKNEKPRFYFVEKLIPHHVRVRDDIKDVNVERVWYMNRIKEANTWIKELVIQIETNDPKAIIIILADHGGMLGIDDFQEKYENDNKENVNSIFSVLAAIKWNGYLLNSEDDKLASNVNLFRVIFSILSNNTTYLDYMEDDSSYNLSHGSLRKSVQKVITDKGEYVLK